MAGLVLCSAGPPAQELSDKLFRIASLLFSSLRRQLTIIILLLKNTPSSLSLSYYFQFSDVKYLGREGAELEKMLKDHQHFC